jgi:uncharacterized membrane protein (UPF0127 family)
MMVELKRSPPECLGHYSRRNSVCRSCRYRRPCTKVIARDEVERLLRQILELAEGWRDPLGLKRGRENEGES